MAVKAPSVASTSTLNPHAPLFVPAAYRATEDFSPEWWRLVQTCPAFTDFWLRERFQCTDDGGDLTADDIVELEAIEEFEMLQLEINKKLPLEDDDEVVEELERSCMEGPKEAS